MSIIDRVARLTRSSSVYGGARNVFDRMGGGFILAYHHITPELWLDHLDCLKPLQPIPFDELLERKSKNLSTNGIYSVTFDDGYADTLLPVFDLAYRHVIPITCYLQTEYMDGKIPDFLRLLNLERLYLSNDIVLRCDGRIIETEMEKKSHFASLQKKLYTKNAFEIGSELDELCREGIAYGHFVQSDVDEIPRSISWNEARDAGGSIVEFQSHCVSHRSLVSLSKEEIEDEYVRSKDILKTELGIEIRHLCYPYGSPESIGTTAYELAKRHFRSAVTMTRGRINGKDDHLLPRIPVYQKDNPDIVRLKILTK